MRKLKILSTLLLTLILTFAMSITTFAYNYKDYETRSIYDGSAVIIKSNNPKAVNNVVLYMYVDSTDIKIDNNRNFYIFYCKGGEASEGIIYLPLIYEFVPDNKKVYDILNDNEIWTWNFKLENGDYQFTYTTTAGDISLPGIYTLQSDFTFDETISSPTEFVDDSEIITVENGTSIRLYMMYGSKSWREANYEAFKEWAMNTEANFKEIDTNLENADKIENGDILDSIIIEEATPEPPVITPTPSTTPEIEIPTMEDDTILEENKEKNGIGGMIAGGIAIIVLAGLGFVFARKK